MLLPPSVKTGPLPPVPTSVFTFVRSVYKPYLRMIDDALLGGSKRGSGTTAPLFHQRARTASQACLLLLLLLVRPLQAANEAILSVQGSGSAAGRVVALVRLGLLAWVMEEWQTLGTRAL
jgi:hypothetical protein